MGLALVRITHTGIGRPPSTICGRTSMRYSSSPLVLASGRPPARRPLAQLTAFFTSRPIPPARKRLHVAKANTTLTRRLLIADAPFRHVGWWPPESSSYGSAAVASSPGLLAGPRGDCSMRPHFPACNTSRNAAHVHCRRRSSVDRWLPREQRPLLMRLPRGTDRPRKHTGRPHSPRKSATRTPLPQKSVNGPQLPRQSRRRPSSPGAWPRCKLI